MRYQQSNRELWASFFAVLLITLVYLFAMSGQRVVWTWNWHSRFHLDANDRNTLFLA